MNYHLIFSKRLSVHLLCKLFDFYLSSLQIAKLYDFIIYYSRWQSCNLIIPFSLHGLRCMSEYGAVDSYLILSFALSSTYNIIFIFIIIIIEWSNWMITTDQLTEYDKQLNQLAE